ncbi:hypothetical protein WN944_023186 [Citrus x changshan-huyou]|uniref:GRF-type domain-containing protein n=1 Tax=Citrus x changshan-huyou TaxID=2935761 RepID=A0AAP0R0Z2_9ROSI
MKSKGTKTVPTSSCASSSHDNQNSSSDGNLNASHSNETPDAMGINGGVIKFYNKRCYCGRRAIILISMTADNPHRLFYKCFSNRCTFFQWWSPTNNEANEILQRQDLYDVYGKHDWRNQENVGAEFSGRFNKIESMISGTKRSVNMIIIILLVMFYVLVCKMNKITTNT